MFKSEGFRKRKVETVSTSFYLINSKKSWFYWFENENSSLKSRKYPILFPKLILKFNLFLNVGTFFYSNRKNKFARKLLKVKYKKSLENEYYDYEN